MSRFVLKLRFELSIAVAKPGKPGRQLTPAKNITATGPRDPGDPDPIRHPAGIKGTPWERK